MPSFRPEILLALIGALLLGACGPSERDLAAARGRYAATVDGFVVRQEPLPGPGPAAPPRLQQDVDLGLAIRHDASEELPRLPGITLEVAQVDAAGRDKRRWRVWIDAPGLAPGEELRRIHVLKDVEYTPGDGFRAEVRQSIPEAERSDYRELSDRELG